eukprot:c20275_g1_i1.p1 GENE.c20275_g1_i1~~c20275_g1_i1.p1  ORF type:complete len:597 (+),score=132.25 c20275_g1_i1:444-2234(+)
MWLVLTRRVHNRTNAASTKSPLSCMTRNATASFAANAQESANTRVMPAEKPRSACPNFAHNSPDVSTTRGKPSPLCNIFSKPQTNWATKLSRRALKLDRISQTTSPRFALPPKNILSTDLWDLEQKIEQIRETVSACEQMLLDQVNRAIKTKSFELHDFQQCLSNRLLCSEYSMNSASQLTDTSPLASVVVARDQLTAIVRQFQPASLARNLSKTGVPRVELDHDAVHQIQGILDSLTNVIQIEDDEFDFDWGVDPIPQQIAAENDETPSSGSEGETHNSNDAIKAILHAVDSGKRTTHDAAPEIARIFRHNRVLSTLKLPSSNIQDNAAVALGEALRKNTTIVNAILYSNHIGDSGANELGQALITNKRLEELHLRGNQIGDKGARGLAQGLAGNTTLTQLLLYGNHIEDSGAVALANSLAKNTKLTLLNLFGNRIGDTGAIALAEALHTNNALASLSLQGNKIGEAGAKALAEALHTNKALTALILGAYPNGNLIGDAGAEAFAAALEKNQTLVELRLDVNQIGDVGAKAFARALKHNTSLKQLWLKSNQVKDEGAQELLECLHDNIALQTLDLNSNTCDRRLPRSIDELLQAR